MGQNGDDGFITVEDRLVNTNDKLVKMMTDLLVMAVACDQTRVFNMAYSNAQANTTKPGYYADGGGLYLQVSKSGTKSWVYRFTLLGKTRDMGLGSLNYVSIADARASMPGSSQAYLTQDATIPSRTSAGSPAQPASRSPAR